MKRLVLSVASVLSAASLFAQEAAKADQPAQPTEARRVQNAVWPAFFALGEYPANPDVVGLRLTIPFSTRQENVTGLDLGFWGRSVYFEGIQVNLTEAFARCERGQAALTEEQVQTIRTIIENLS